MIGRVLELTQPGLALHRRRGFLTVESADGEAGRLAFDDIEAVLVTSRAVMWSNDVLAGLASRQVPVMVLGEGFTPVAVLLALDGHHRQAALFRAQAGVSRPFRKQAWAALVRRKIMAQATALEQCGEPSERLRRLAATVRSGDPDNREAQAAQAYWPRMMGAGFRRDRHLPGENAMLNYGYAVLRAATARAIVAAGLHPALALQHRSGGDALALADDLMEPFRPVIDLTVRRLSANGIRDVPAARAELVACLAVNFRSPLGTSPLSRVLLRLAQSLAASCETGRLALCFPDSLVPAADEEPDDD